MKSWLVLILILLSSLELRSQSSKTYLDSAFKYFPSEISQSRRYFDLINSNDLANLDLWRLKRLIALYDLDNGDLSKGLNKIIELLEIIPLNANTSSLCASLNDDIGDAYIQIERNNELALSYYTDAIEIRREYNLLDQLAESNYNLAGFYLRERNTIKAIELLNIARNQILDSNSRLNANILYLKGVIFGIRVKEGQKELSDSANYYLELAGDIYKDIDSEFYTTILIERGILEFQTGSLEASNQILESLIIEHPLSQQQAIRIFSILSDSYYALKLFEKAYTYEKLENDSLRQRYGNDRFQTAAQITEDYRTDKQLDQAEATAFLQSRRAKTFGIAAVSLLIILLISYLIFLQTIQRKKLENLQALIRGEEQERQRLASDLHDGIGVLLTSIKMRLSSFEEKVDDQKAYHQSLGQIDEACVEVRRVSHNLSPASLNKLGLEEAILDLFDQVKKNSIEVKAEVQFEEGKIDKDNEILLYRIIQELINNSLKYAQPSKLNLALNMGKDHLNLSYHDQGIGFDKQKIKPGLGLKSIASRVDIMKGKFTYQSILGEGSQFDIIIPINA